MKPLNRPMFKYGGPIKEGIMNGMKDNRQAINTVGSPLAPKDESGRGGYALPLLGFLGANAIRTGAMRMAPRIASGIKNIFGKTRPFQGPVGSTTTTPGTFIRSRGVRIPSSGSYSGVKFVPGTTTPVAKGPALGEAFVPNAFVRYLQRSPEGRFLTGAGGKAGAVGKKVIGAGKSLASSPLTVGSAGVYGAKGLYNALTGEKEPEVQKEIEAAGGPPGGGDPNMFARPKEKVVNQEELEKMNKDRIQKNKERYYKLMGLDKMNKDAVYDSLIDASKIISEEGADLKGAVKSGTLQNRIIQAISGQLDKSAALKRQIDAAVLKGEIEKDIKSSDPQAKKRAELIDKQIALADQKLSGGSLIENIQAGAKAQGNINSTSNVYNSILKTYKVEPEVLADTAETLKFRKADNYTTDAALVKSLVEAQGKGAGIYIIDKTAVLIDENGNASTLFQG
jgi:hypothetical protein